MVQTKRPNISELAGSSSGELAGYSSGELARVLTMILIQ